MGMWPWERSHLMTLLGLTLDGGIPGNISPPPHTAVEPAPRNNAGNNQELCGSRSPDAADTNLANEFHMKPGISGSFPPCLCITTRVMHVVKLDTVEPWASMQKELSRERNDGSGDYLACI